ncbi:MAG: RluA family pseudouridine synthase [Chloroflexi bacterium]|nr:RluA family pseudouridine synthase [Chloroflexota bacterium]
MSRTRSFVAERDGDRLDRFLDDRCEDLSRSRLQRLIAEGMVTLEGRPTKAGVRLRKGQSVEVTVPEPVESHLEPQDIPLSVIYQDEDLAVVDKPAGLVVHPAPGHPDGTLVNALLALCPDLQGIGGTVRPGIVHRLDKDTSGLMVVAKNERAHKHLSAQLKARKFKKLYKALVCGHLASSPATIEANIGRDPGNRKRMAVVDGGKAATTHYEVIRYYEAHTLVEVRLETGRTHQIRVHFAAIGHPVAGDETYGVKTQGLTRQFLHASTLGFRLPSDDSWVEFNSELPEDLESYLRGIAPARVVVR